MTFWDGMKFWVAKGLVALAGMAVLLIATFVILFVIAHYEMWRERRHATRIPENERCSMCRGYGTTQGKRCQTCSGSGRRHHFI